MLNKILNSEFKVEDGECTKQGGLGAGLQGTHNLLALI